MWLEKHLADANWSRDSCFGVRGTAELLESRTRNSLKNLMDVRVCKDSDPAKAGSMAIMHCRRRELNGDYFALVATGFRGEPEIIEEWKRDLTPYSDLETQTMHYIVED